MALQLDRLGETVTAVAPKRLRLRSSPGGDDFASLGCMAELAARPAEKIQWT